MPYDVRTGKLASVTDPRTWGTYRQARAAVPRFDGLGFVLSAGDPYCGLDLDRCRDPRTGEIESWARKIIEALNSYTEVSPSGTGLHVIARGALPAGWRRRGRVELYDRGRYLTVTGNHILGTPETVEERSKEILALHARLTAASDGAPTEGRAAQGLARDKHAVPERWARMLERGYAAAVAHWEGRAGGHQDQSGSGKDLKLAWFCRKHGFNQEETAAIIAHAPYAVGGGRPANYIVRTVQKAFAGKGTRRSSPGEGYGALWAKIVTSGNWASLPDPQKAVYIPLVVLAVRPSGLVRAGREKLAKLAGISVDKVSRATTGLARAGLIRKRPAPMGVNYWVLTPADFPADLTCTAGTATQVSRVSPPISPESPAASEVPPRYPPKRQTGQSVGYPRNRHTCASDHEMRGGAPAPAPPLALPEGGREEENKTGALAPPSKRLTWEILPDGTRITYQKQGDGTLVEIGREKA